MAETGRYRLHTAVDMNGDPFYLVYEGAAVRARYDSRDKAEQWIRNHAEHLEPPRQVPAMTQPAHFTRGEKVMRRGRPQEIGVILDGPITAASGASYQVFFSADERRMTVVQIHPNAASMERHMDVAREAFAPFADLLDLRTVDVYGEPSAKVIDQLRRKAELLGTASVEVHDLQAGFLRIGASAEVGPPA